MRVVVVVVRAASGCLRAADVGETGDRQGVRGGKDPVVTQLEEAVLYVSKVHLESKQVTGAITLGLYTCHCFTSESPDDAVHLTQCR